MNRIYCVIQYWAWANLGKVVHQLQISIWFQLQVVPGVGITILERMEGHRRNTYSYIPCTVNKANKTSNHCKNRMKEAGSDSSIFMVHSIGELESCHIQHPKHRHWSANGSNTESCQLKLFSPFCQFYSWLTWVTTSSLFGQSMTENHEQHQVVSWLCCWDVSRISEVQCWIPWGSQIWYGLLHEEM